MVSGSQKPRLAVGALLAVVFAWSAQAQDGSSQPPSHFEPVEPPGHFEPVRPDGAPRPPPPAPTYNYQYVEPTGPMPGSRADFDTQVVSDSVYFDLDSIDLTDEARSVLESQARWLVANPSARIAVEGHADEPGSREENLAIGERRAATVHDYLLSMGVAAERITTISYGKERPVTAEQDAEHRALNRRATTVILD